MPIRRFDLGGTGSAPEWVTVHPTAPADLRCDVTDLDRLAPEDGSVEAFRLRHTLERVPAAAHGPFLRHLYRKLVPGGRLEIVLTDAGEVLRQWARGERSFRSMRAALLAPAPSADPPPGGPNLWTPVELARDLRAAGFDVEPVDAGLRDLDPADALFPADLLADREVPVRCAGLRAVKPAPVRRIPNELHFVFGMRPDFGGRPFSLVHYLAVRSAVEVNRPDRARLWYAHEPAGEWWDRARPLVEPCRVPEVADFDGVPLDHYAHRADVVRLRVLIEHGGIYLDLDTVCVRPFTDLLHHPVVVGHDAPDGLCNAVILAEPGSEFLRRCLAAHRLFRPGMWAEVCNGELTRIARAAPYLVHALGRRAFHWPDWSPDGYQLMHGPDGPEFPGAYCHHLWEHVSWDRGLKDLSVAALRAGTSTYARIARRFLPAPGPEGPLAGSEAPRPAPAGPGLVIAVCTCARHADRQAGCRETWVPAARALPGVAVLFFDGGPPGRPDVVGLECPDDWAALPLKMARLVGHVAAAYPGAWLFKCDDDTFVAPARLAAFLRGGRGDYTGYVLEHDGVTYTSGGAGYLLSPAAVRVLAAGLTGGGAYEDVEAGRVLAQAGIRPEHSDRLRPNRDPGMPADRITEHYVDPAGMRALWRAAPADPAPGTEPLSPAEPGGPAAPPGRTQSPVRIVAAATGYGALGLGGWRGHAVAGSDRVEPPPDAVGWAGYEFLAAHAPSRVEVDLDAPHAVVGFLDGPSWPTPGRPTRFRIDGRPVAALEQPHARAPEHLLPAGRHVLETECPDPITRRYPVWALRPVAAGELRIVMPTSNAYVGVARSALRLLHAFWPDHPPVDVVCHDAFVPVPAGARVRQFPAGPQRSVPWTRALAGYLREHNAEEFLLLLLDDYGLCAPPRRDRLAAARRVLWDDFSVASVGLTAMAVPSREPYAGDHGAGLIEAPPWAYSVHTQAALWRRTGLLRALDAAGPVSAAAFELAASAAHNARERGYERHLFFAGPPDTPLFLDSDPRKHEWALPYHNLMHAGQPDPRHAAFLAAECPGA